MFKSLLYSFNSNISDLVAREVAKKLNADTYSINCKTQKIEVASIHNLVEHVLGSNYKYVIGIGAHSYRRKILIEKYATNNTKIISEEFKSYKISEFIKIPNNLSKSIVYSDWLNGWCNYSVFLLSHKIHETEVKTKVGFTHIPKNLEKVEIYSKEIIKLLEPLD